MIRRYFTWVVEGSFTKKERRGYAELADAAMLPDDGLTILDDETNEEIDKAWVLSKYKAV